LWKPNNVGWWVGGVITSASATTTNNPGVTLQTLTVGGYTNYFVNFSFSQANTNATTTGTITAQLLDGLGAVIGTQELGVYTASTRNGWAGSVVITAPNYGVQSFTMTLAAYVSSGTCYIGHANLTVVGLS
jgi:hypothetical protein